MSGCSRLRLATETLDGVYHLHPYSWDGLWGFPGRRGVNVPVIGRPGSYRVEGKETEERIATLGIQIRRRSSTGTITLPGGACEHVEANQDLILGLMGSDDLQTLEWDGCDGVMRYLEVEFVEPAPIAHVGLERQLPVVLRAPYPYWREADVSSPITSGPTNVNPGGNAPVEDCTLSFAAAGRITNALGPEHVEVDPALGDGNPVAFDCLTGSAVQTGVEAAKTIVSIGSDRLFRLKPAVNNPLTVTAGTVTVTHRPTWW